MLLRRVPAADGPRSIGFELAERLGAAFSVERVFGQPVERDGATVVPVALVRGAAFGASGGFGIKGGGSAFAAQARPLGVVVVRRGSATFRPVIDLQRALLVAPVVAAVAAAALVGAAGVVRLRRERRARREPLTAVPDRP